MDADAELADAAYANDDGGPCLSNEHERAHEYERHDATLEPARRCEWCWRGQYQ